MTSFTRKRSSDRTFIAIGPAAFSLMSADTNRNSLSAPQHAALFAHENVLPAFIAWRKQGQRAALVTIVGIEGAGPRPLGAQMAVTAEGQSVGYLSGGCLEAAVIEEAKITLRKGENRLVRYGKGSQYIDVKLPCGSGLDIYIDQAISLEDLVDVERLIRNRRVLQMETDLDKGATTFALRNMCNFLSERNGMLFRRTWVPSLRLILIGSGPAVAAIAVLASAAGFQLDIATPSDATRLELRHLGFEAEVLTSNGLPAFPEIDPWTAAVLAFHEHDWEPPLLKWLLSAESFYVGAVGSGTVRAARAQELEELGIAADSVTRLRSPIGLIQGARSRLTLAVGVVAEIVQEAKARGFVQ